MKLPAGVGDNGTEMDRKKLGFLGEMLIPGLRQGNYKIRLESLLVTESEEFLLKAIRIYQKYPGARLATCGMVWVST